MKRGFFSSQFQMSKSMALAVAYTRMREKRKKKSHGQTGSKRVGSGQAHTFITVLSLEY